MAINARLDDFQQLTVTTTSNEANPDHSSDLWPELSLELAHIMDEDEEGPDTQCPAGLDVDDSIDDDVHARQPEAPAISSRNVDLCKTDGCTAHSSTSSSRLP